MWGNNWSTAPHGTIIQTAVVKFVSLELLFGRISQMHGRILNRAGMGITWHFSLQSHTGVVCFVIIMYIKDNKVKIYIYSPDIPEDSADFKLKYINMYIHDKHYQFLISRYVDYAVYC